MLFINTQPELHIHKGDSVTFNYEVFIGNNLDKNTYQLDKDDEIYFALMEPNQCWENAILKKKLLNSESSELNINLDPKDTMCLLPGLYYYQIKIRKNINTVYTLNNRAKLYILE